MWLASDDEKRREYALKLIDLSAVGGDPKAEARALREAEALATLDHPSICRCHRIVADDERRFFGIVMDFVDGTPLSDVLGDPRLTQPVRENIASHLANALAHIHEHGLVHRDVKLDNILLTKRFWRDPAEPANLLIVDFGIASSAEGGRLTKTGQVFGTPAYMAPEQIEPEYWGSSTRTPATDVFAFGIVVWKLFAGGHPTKLPEHATFGDYLSAYRRAESSAAWPPDFPPGGSAEIVRRCLALRVADRAADAVELLRQLRAERVSVGADGEFDLTPTPRSVGPAPPTPRTPPRKQKPVTKTAPGGPLFEGAEAADPPPARARPANRPTRRSRSFGRALLVLCSLAVVAAAGGLFLFDPISEYLGFPSHSRPRRRAADDVAAPAAQSPRSDQSTIEPFTPIVPATAPPPPPLRPSPSAKPAPQPSAKPAPQPSANPAPPPPPGVQGIPECDAVAAAVDKCPGAFRGAEAVILGEYHTLKGAMPQAMRPGMASGCGYLLKNFVASACKPAPPAPSTTAPAVPPSAAPPPSKPSPPQGPKK